MAVNFNIDLDLDITEFTKAFGDLDRFAQILVFIMFSSVILLAFTIAKKLSRRLTLAYKGIQSKLLALQKYISKSNNF